MKLTIEDLSKRTKLSIPTLRVYVSRQKLGKKIGNNRFFSQADVDKLMKGSRKTSGKKAPAKRTAAKQGPASRGTKAAKASRKRVVRAAPARASAPAPKPAVQQEKAEQKPQAPKRSFWSRLFPGRRPAQKISLMQVQKQR